MKTLCFAFYITICSMTYGIFTISFSVCNDFLHFISVTSTQRNTIIVKARFSHDIITDTTDNKFGDKIHETTF